jgi:hypothetical protein
MARVTVDDKVVLYQVEGLVAVALVPDLKIKEDPTTELCYSSENQLPGGKLCGKRINRKGIYLCNSKEACG